MSHVSHERTRPRSSPKVRPYQVWPRLEKNCTRESGNGVVSIDGQTDNLIPVYFVERRYNKAKLRDLIAATGLIILPKLDSNNRFFGLYDLEIWCKIIGHISATSNFLQHFKAIAEFKLELQFGNAQFWSKSSIFCSVWPWQLADDLENEKDTCSMLLQALCIIS